MKGEKYVRLRPYILGSCICCNGYCRAGIFSIDLDLVCHRRSCYIHNGVVRSRIRNSDACFYCSINSSSIVYQAFIKKICSKKIQPTNIELDVGKTAVVIEEINNKIDTGRAKLNGVDWKAVSADDSIIPEGSIVRIDNIRGTKLYVTLYKEKINL